MPRWTASLDRSAVKIEREIFHAAPGHKLVVTQSKDKAMTVARTCSVFGK